MADGFVKRRNEVAKGNVDLDWIGVFTFPSILKLARRYGHLDLPDYEIKALKDIRNNVAHSDKLLITRYEDMTSLEKAHRMIQEIIEG